MYKKVKKKIKKFTSEENNKNQLVIGFALSMAFLFTLFISNYLSTASEYHPFKPENKELAKAIEELPNNINYTKKKLEELKDLNSKDRARKSYLLGVLAQKNKDYKKALLYYSNINKQDLPYLADRVILHQAEIYIQQGNETEIMKLCRKIINEFPESLSLPKAYYELGRSYLRQSRREEAKELFKSTYNRFPKTDQGLASAYYLGQLTTDTTQKDKLWSIYLEKEPKGLFSGTIVQKWLAKDNLTPKEKTLMGLYYYHKGENTRAVQYFKGNINELNWFEYAQALLKENKKISAQPILKKGLRSYPFSKHYEDAISNYIRYYSVYERSTLFEELIGLHPQHGAHILWRTTSYKRGNKLYDTYKRIVKSYPNSIYSGKSSSELFMRAVKAKQYTKAIALGEKHLKKYKQSHYSAKVLFWLAKIKQKQGNNTQTTNYAAETISNYPTSYYAYRAKQKFFNVDLLKPRKYKRKINTIPDHRALLLPVKEIQKLHPTIQELFALNLWKEATQLLPKDLEEKYPALYYWNIAKVKGDIRTAINETSFELRKSYAKYEDMSDFWAIAYPFSYWDHAVTYGNKYNVDPLLILSIIRQESRFQPHAVSRSNAIGLCQLLPSTAREMYRSTHPGQRFYSSCLKNPKDNITLGTKYIGNLLRQFDNNIHFSIGAYNAGPGSMRRWLLSHSEKDLDNFIENIAYSETRNYITQVIENYWIYYNLYNQELEKQQES